MSIGETLVGGPRGRRAVRRRRSPRPPGSAAPSCEAIEADDFSPCGGDFYARGHIRTIAATVGARPDAAARRVRRRPRARQRRPGPPRSSSPRPAPAPERRGPNWTAAMAAALVLVVVYGVGAGRQRQQATASRPRASAAPRRHGRSSSGEPPRPPRRRPPSTSGSSAVAQAPRDRVTVVLRARRRRSWVQATTASGKELFQGTLRARPGQDLHRPTSGSSSSSATPAPSR